MTEHVDIAAPPSVIGPPGTAIEIRGLSKQFASNGSVVSALEGVDLAIEQGEFLCVVGLSGCGKTTLLNILGGLGQASAGGVEFPPQALGKPLRSIVFQEHGVSSVAQAYGPVQFRLNCVGGDLTKTKVVRAERPEKPSLLTQALGPLDFEHNPGFLISRIARRMAAEMDRRMRAHGLTAAQAAVMSRLWWQDGLTQSQVQEQVGVDASTLTGLLQRMTRQGLVRRRRDPADGRVLRVFLTPHGRDLRPVLTPEAESINSLFFGGFSSGERAIFIEFLHRALRNLEPEEEETREVSVQL